jgi:hypothetical protein
MSSAADDMNKSPLAGSQLPDRFHMIRDVAVFQVKLLADGFRDLLLVPMSLAAALISLLKKGPKPGTEFYDLLRLGRQSEHWINLFGAASQVHGPPDDDERFPADDIDKLVSKVESFVVDEYRSGGVTAQARQKLERALAALRERNRQRF